MQQHTVDLQEEKAPDYLATRSKSDKPRDRRKQEIPKGCRTAVLQKRGTGSWRDPVEIHLLRVGRPPTRTEDRPQERTGARTDAMGPNSFLPRRIRECAIQPRRRRLRAKQTWVAPRLRQSSDLPVTAPRKQADFLQIAAANRVILDERAHLTRLMGGLSSSR